MSFLISTINGFGLYLLVMSSSVHVHKKSVTTRPFVVTLFIVAIILTLRSFNPGIHFPTKVQDFLTLTFSVILEALPFVLLGVFLSSLFQVFVPVDKVFAFLPSNPVLRRLLLSFVGFLLPVCECGNVPMARGMLLKNFSVSEASTFLLAAPVVNPITLFTTFQVFGWQDGIFVARILGVLFIAHLIGWLFSLHPNSHKLLTTKFEIACSRHKEPSDSKKLSGFVSFFQSELSKMIPLLILGGAVAGAAQVVLPREVLYSVGQDPILSILVMMVLAVIVAVCSNVDSFFALTFVGLFLPGSILVFLIVGPLMDIKMIALLRSTFKTRTVVLMGSVILSVAMVFGVVVNIVWG